jgi:hypothetical protein
MLMAEILNKQTLGFLYQNALTNRECLTNKGKILNKAD